MKEDRVDYLRFVDILNGDFGGIWKRCAIGHWLTVDFGQPHRLTRVGGEGQGLEQFCVLTVKIAGERRTFNMNILERNNQNHTYAAHLVNQRVLEGRSWGERERESCGSSVD